MALAYRQPGINVEETIISSTSPILSSLALVCLVGLAQGFQTRTDQFVLNGTSPVILPGLALNSLQSVASVKDALNPSKGATDGSGYVVTTDYTISTANGTITRVAAGGMSDGTLINVTYTFVAPDYYLPVRMFDQGSVETRYGSSLNSTGTAINSPVSYAAQIAFENGAGSVVIQPLLTRATPGDPTSLPGQPTATQAAAATSWADTLYGLRDIEDINVLVPIVGQSQANVGDSNLLNILQVVQDHVYFMQQQDQYIISVSGQDASASTSVAQAATLRTHANTLRGRYGGVVAEQIVCVSPSKFVRSLPNLGQSTTVGGQYAAAGVAGMLSSRGTSSSLTRKTLSGFTSVADARSLSDKNTDAGAGLFVIEQRGGNIVVRHAITLDQTSSARRELSVVRAKHRMIESVKTTLDKQIVGNILADNNAPSTVSATVVGVLESLRQSRDLVDYTGVNSRLLSLDPTTIQVRFSYRPAFPLNYIDISFSLDLSTGSITANDTNTQVLT
jgi:hypothetical protein